MTILLDAQGVHGAIQRLADAVYGSIPADAALGVIGIRARGDILARRLIDVLAQRGVTDVTFGSLDITLYRDDLAEIGPRALVRTTEIDFDVAGRLIVLVDDVIHTGRSIRAALDAITDLGRPRAIRLAVLVDRGGRELPIQPDFVGIRAPGEEQHVDVLLAETSGVDRVEARP